MAKSIFSMRQEIAGLNREIDGHNDYMIQNASNPDVPVAELERREGVIAELEKRRNYIQGQIAREEASQRAAMELNGAGDGGAGDARMATAKNFAGFLRALREGDRARATSFKAKLGAIPEGDSGLGGGENLLPTNMTTELIHEPFDTNPMRNVVSISQITNLEMPRVAYTIDDDDFIDDKAVAQEMVLRGDKQSFGRYKFKVKVRISDTVMYGTDTDLIQYVRNALASGLATKEKKQMFGDALPSDEQHMSLYMAGLRQMTGPTLFDAIIEALGDLPDAFAENASVVMKRADYLREIRELANGNATLWGQKPQDVIGVPVVFCDRAATPVVGDMRYARINYDIPLTYDEDKDVESGDFVFVITAWFDIQYLLTSAFRLAVVDDGVIEP